MPMQVGMKARMTKVCMQSAHHNAMMQKKL
jgi:hypothetical protein